MWQKYQLQVKLKPKSKLPGPIGNFQDWSLTSLFVVQRLWLRAGEGRLASPGPEAQRETGPRPCGSTGFLGNPWLHSLLAMSVWRSRVRAGPACWVTACPHARFLPMPDAPYFNPLLCYFTQPASICHTAWKNPQVRGDCQRPVRGRLPPFLLPVQQRL